MNNSDFTININKVREILKLKKRKSSPLHMTRVFIASTWKSRWLSEYHWDYWFNRAPEHLRDKIPTPANDNIFLPTLKRS